MHLPHALLASLHQLSRRLYARTTRVLYCQCHNFAPAVL